jgi:hypothetical protein
LDRIASKLIKFSFTSLLKHKNFNLNKRNLRYLKKRNVNKILISDILFKHSSNKINITLFVYTRSIKYIKYFYNMKKLNYAKNINKKYIPLFNINNILNRKNNLSDFLSEYIYNNVIIKFKIIMLKRPFYESSILSKYAGRFLKFQKSRYIKIKNKLFAKIKRPFYNKNIFNKDMFYKRKLSNLSNLDNIHSFNIFTLNEDKLIKNFKKLNLNLIFKTIKYKYLNGINIIMNGRITRRRIAQRALSKSFSRGCFKNIDSSFKRNSVYLERNSKNPNINISTYKSYTRNGSFNFGSKLSGL